MHYSRSFRSFLGSVEDRYVPLSHLEVTVFFDEISKGNIDARNEFVGHNLGLVVNALCKFDYLPFEAEDVFQMGCEGLIRAVDNFDPAMGFQFSTYADKWISGAIERGINDNAFNIRIPQKAKSRMLSEGEDISFQRTYSLDEPARSITGELLDLTLTDTIRSDLPIPEMAIGREIAYETIDNAVECLSDRERQILTLHYGLHGTEPMSFSRIGNVLGLSKQAVCKAEKKAIAKLRKLDILEAYYRLYID